MTTTIALKEWAVVVRALEAGRQLLLVRKGGIRDPRGAFELAHQQFLLYPTAEHQEASAIRPEFRARFAVDPPGGPSAAGILFRVYAQVALAREIRDPGLLGPLEEFHIWTPEFLEERMRYRPQAPTGVIAVRVYRLPNPVAHAVRPEYAGCRSWVTLADPIPLDGAEPALEDRRFQAALEKIVSVLEG